MESNRCMPVPRWPTPCMPKHRQIAITAAVRPPPATSQHDAWRQRPTGWWRHFLRWWRTTSGRRLFPQLPLRGWRWLFTLLPVWWGGKGGNTRGWGCTPFCSTRHKQPASSLWFFFALPRWDFFYLLSFPWFLTHWQHCTCMFVYVSLFCPCLVSVMLWSHLVEDGRDVEDGTPFRTWKAHSLFYSWTFFIDVNINSHLKITVTSDLFLFEKGQVLPSKSSSKILSTRTNAQHKYTHAHK